MFDANGAAVEIGKYFFAEVVSANTVLEFEGIQSGDIILCQHQLRSQDNPRHHDATKIWASRGSEGFIYRSGQSLLDRSYLIYSGTPDGKNFIDKDWENKALSFMGGKWADLKKDDTP